MTTQTFAEAALSGLPQNERWRRRHLQVSNDDESPAVENRLTGPLSTHSGQLTALEERIAEHQNKLAVRAFMKRERAKLTELKEQLAQEQQGPPKSAAEFARRVKSVR